MVERSVRVADVLLHVLQFPTTARRFISASTASTLCTFTIAATLTLQHQPHQFWSPG